MHTTPGAVGFLFFLIIKYCNLVINNAEAGVLAVGPRTLKMLLKECIYVAGVLVVTFFPLMLLQEYTLLALVTKEVQAVLISS